MTTIKQRKALKNMVENGGNISKAMIVAGYSPKTAKTPQKLTNSIGFIELCESIGLSDSLLVTALLEDIQSKKGNRRAELELGFKIKGLLIQKTENDNRIKVSLSEQRIEEIKKALWTW